MQVVSKKRPPLESDRDPDLSEDLSIENTPASLNALPAFNDIIRACWAQREAKRPSANAVHQMLINLLQQYGYELGPDETRHAAGLLPTRNSEILAQRMKTLGGPDDQVATSKRHPDAPDTNTSDASTRIGVALPSASTAGAGSGITRNVLAVLNEQAMLADDVILEVDEDGIQDEDEDSSEGSESEDSQQDEDSSDDEENGAGSPAVNDNPVEQRNRPDVV